MKVKMKVKITKKNKPWVIVSIIFILLVMIVNIIHDNTVKENACYGIGVDSTGQLYVAKNDMIEIYTPTGEMKKIECRHIDPKKRFTIQDDYIVIPTTIDGYQYQKLDLNGNELIERVDISQEEYRSLREKSYVFETESGDVYEYNLDEFQYRILLNGDTVIYEEPMFYAVIERLFFIIPLLMFIVVGITTYRISKDNNWKKKKPFPQATTRNRDRLLFTRKP